MMESYRFWVTVTVSIFTEFRTILPFSLDEYGRGQRYWNVALSYAEGEELIREEPFTSTTLKPGKKLTGIYAQKIQRSRSDIPYFLRKLMPNTRFILHEESWNAYPYSKTVLTNPYFSKEDFCICVESYHVEDRGEQQNLLELSDDELKMREVVFLDFAGDKKVLEFKSEKAGHGPLTKGWEQNHYPIMCSYKVVTVNFNWFGLQFLTEFTLMEKCKENFLFFYREAYLNIDMWCDLTLEVIQLLEEKLQERKRKKKENRDGTMAAVGTFEIELKKNL